ncbi:hypothetical protein L3Q82_002654 [Scortum barcoo]|uniref:Uncharacterized protein n=1 Tax=Scortum barcoo TaxID=214431 RepID=A0ACB8VV89_9TELE|nr:hypothetical protein L3Q82_002654 [Scortum barcoo]
MFSASIVDAAVQFEVVDAKVSLVPVVVAIPNPVVDTGSKGCCQTEEGVLSDHVGLWDSLTQLLTGTGRPSKPQPGRSWRQKLGSGRSSVRPWRRTIGRPRRDSGKPSAQPQKGKQYSANTVYSARVGSC